MSKHPKRIILVNGEERVGSLLLAEPCSSFGPRTFQKSSWTKPQKKDKETISTATNSKKRSAWIASSFSDFDEGNTKKTKQANINHSLVTSESSQAAHQKFRKDEDLWLEKYKPKSELELAVHKKKVAEVRNWFLDQLCTQVGHGSILLLTGPTGAGKTATVNVLASELGFEVQEWLNPLSDTEDEGYFNWKSHSQSQVKIFQDFIVRASKYPTLSIFGGKGDNSVKKIVLVEDLPNIFFREASKLQEVLSTYKQRGQVPIVFVISDSHHGDSNVHKLLPKDVQEKLKIHNISFNPIAQTSLVKALNRIISTEAQLQNKTTFEIPVKDTVQLLAQNSGGDIRTAINGLQFSSSKDKSRTTQKGSNVTKKDDRKPNKSKLKKTSSSLPNKMNTSESVQLSSKCLLYGKETRNNLESEAVTAIGGRDSALFLFRALGKILYCKRDPTLSDSDLLPSHLSHHARNQLLFCPEEVLEKTHLSSEFFNLYLHQNYLEFSADIDDVVNISEHFSEADYMTKEWMFQSSMKEYSSCLAARGLIFNSRSAGKSSSSSGSGRGWRPLHKPQLFEVNRKMRDGVNTAQDLFRDYHCPSLVLQTEVLPYLAITDVPLRTPGQIAFLQAISNFRKSKHPFRGGTDMLDEKDCGMNSDNDDEVHVSSQPNGNGTQGANKCLAMGEECDSQGTSEMPRDDDDVIEDFDDEDF